MQEIYNEGGRKFGFVNVAPLRCSPFLRTFVNGTTIEACLKEQGSALARLQKCSSQITSKTRKTTKGFKYSIFNLYDALLESIKYPSKYGIYMPLICVYITVFFRKRSKLHILESSC